MAAAIYEVGSPIIIRLISPSPISHFAGIAAPTMPTQPAGAELASFRTGQRNSRVHDTWEDGGSPAQGLVGSRALHLARPGAHVAATAGR
jgi:hypothetical protein